ncbi:MAG: sporulation inhibitor of replication protein SirA [Bacillus sp. (in: firmicutes)]
MTMRKYQIYLIDEKFAEQYIGKENLFFSLFNDYYHAKGDYAAIIGKQVNYVTRKIPEQVIKVFTDFPSDDHQHISYDKGVYYIHLRENNGHIRSKAILTYNQRMLQVTSEGTFDAEALLFEVLRKSKKSFMAVDVENMKYGWLNPVKERKLI